ncbi:MAG: hypothetical protein ACI4QL_01705, partial [Candidatus Fimimonas sp.]
KMDLFCDRMQSQNGFGTSEKQETATLTMDLSKFFDVEYLKRNGYSMTMKITYTADYLTSSLGELNYKFWIENRSGTVHLFKDTINGKVNRTVLVNTLQSEAYDATMFAKLLTGNIQGVKLTNMTFHIEFSQPAN